MKKTILIYLSVFIAFQTYAQGPYRLKPIIDVPLTVGGAGLSLLGLNYLKSKPRLDSAYVVTLGPEDVNKFDRGATRMNDKNAQMGADIALFSSNAAPFFLLLDKKIRSEGLKVTFLYIETMAIMANAYVWGVGSTKRIRPYVYNPEVPLDEKLGKGTTNSFYAGHPAAAAASTFFLAKVYSDYHPESKLRKFIWAAAVVPPITVAYFRYRGGQHFPTDILAGIPIGAAIGIIVPHLHKVKTSDKISVFPAPGGLGMIYRLR